MRDRNDCLEEVRDRVEELEYEMSQEFFCEGCDAVRTVYEVEEYWGAAVRRWVEDTCDAEMVPGDDGCEKQAEYEALEEELKEALRKISALEKIKERVVA